jgi:PAS domain-containing protein
MLNQEVTKLLTDPPKQEPHNLIHETMPADTILGLAASAREVVGRRRNGETLSLELTGGGMPVGNATVSVVFLRDVSKRKRAPRYLIAHYAATCVLAESDSFEAALPRILQAICEALRWEAGAFWRFDHAAGVAACAEVYQAPCAALPALPDTRALTCAPQQGLPGRAWATGKPVWVEDLAATRDCPCLELSAALSLHGAFAFPVLLGREVFGVLTFFNCRKQKCDDRLLDIMVELGKQLGQFVARKQGEEDLRKTTQTLQALVQAAPVAIHIADLEGKVRLWNPAAERMFGRSAAGVRRWRTRRQRRRAGPGAGRGVTGRPRPGWGTAWPGPRPRPAPVTPRRRGRRPPR